MKRILLAGVSLVSLGLISGAQAAEKVCDPYKTYTCLDSYLGTDFLTRFLNYYKLEWGKDVPPADPKAPPSRRAEWPGTPQTTPPYPFTEWPYGGSTSLGVTRPASVDSPLMSALSNTPFGKWMADNNIQVYGWVDPSGNLSTSTVRGGNAPAAYAYNPNSIQLDQAVLYIERLPDTVQKDHIDWGFRVAPIYGENYRYTTSYGFWSNQLLNSNQNYGWDMPMFWGELFIPQVAQGLMIRVGRFISIPDIEAQLAPNNYMSSHSMTYTFDNYTNVGIQATLAITKNWILQTGLTVGTEAQPWHLNNNITNLMPGNPIFPGTTFPKDPGAQPSGTIALRYTTDSGNDDINCDADAWNNGTWGYNNLQWMGCTYYHKFNDQWHISMESYNEHQNNVPNLNNAQALAILAGGGTPFSPQFTPANAPGAAFCKSAAVLTCTATYQTALMYLSYKINPLDNISYRAEFVDDLQGQRTGTATRYIETGIGWQHWFSPQIEFRPEVSYYKSLDGFAFNGNANLGIAANRNYAIIALCDMIIHF